MIFKPTFVFSSVSEISVDFLKKNNIMGLILDLDNTLTTHNNPVPPDKILEWIDIMKKNGIALMIVSNNSAERVKPFAEILGLPFVPRGSKPLTLGFSKAQNIMRLNKQNLAVVGDQIFTDILGGSLKGIRTVFVYPIEPEKSILFRIKRIIEKPFLPKRKQL